jgi:flavin reductase (DIM6/NTAB) family NADH-FMN oxidoreductase RutF
MHNKPSRDPASDRDRAMGQIPGGLFVMTSHCEGRSSAVIVKWVQQCASNPPMVMVGLAKGQAIEPMIRDSRRFALCQISADDRFLSRKFSQSGANGDDPLVTMATRLAPSGSPIVERAMAYLDCEVVRHIELDCDFRIYVGQVHAGAVLNQSTPAVCFGGNGMNGQ